MKRSTDRILTTHPGRLPDPPVRDEVMQARSSGDRKRFDELVKAGRRRDASPSSATLGIDIMSDGEFWKARDQLYYGSRATGIEARAGQARRMALHPRHSARAPRAGVSRLLCGLRPARQHASSRRPVNPIGGQPEKSVMIGEVKAKPAKSINADIAVIKAALAEAGVDIRGLLLPRSRPRLARPLRLE